MLELSPSRNANLLALSAILGILGTLVLVWQAGQGVGATTGPSALVTTEEAVYFVAGKTLYQTDGEGALRDSVALVDLGITGTVAELAPMAEALLIADGDGGAVWRCDVARRDCRPFFDVATSPSGTALGLGVATEAGRIYVAESSFHRLYAHDLEGKRLYELSVDGGLKYPNEVHWLGDDQLLVTDTNHHRLVVIQDLGGGRTRLVRQFRVDNGLGRGNSWPTAAVQDDTGQTWVINSDGLLRNGEIIVYDTAGKAVQHIDLGVDADPLVLSQLAGGVVFADYDNFRLHRVESDGYAVTAFGDAEVQTVWRNLQARREHWQQLRNFSIGMMVLFGALGFAAAYLDSRARQQRAKSQRQPGVVQHPSDTMRQRILSAAEQLALRPDAQGIVWVGADTKSLRRIAAVVALALVSLGAMTAVMAMTFDNVPIRLLAMLAGMMLVMALTFAWLWRGIRRLRIGSDGNVIYVQDLFGRRAQGTPEEFVQTGRRLLLGRVGVPLPNPQLSLLDRKSFAAVIEPLLARTPQRSELAILWGDLRRGDPLAWGGMAAIIVVVALRIWFD